MTKVTTESCSALWHELKMDEEPEMCHNVKKVSIYTPPKSEELVGSTGSRDSPWQLMLLKYLSLSGSRPEDKGKRKLMAMSKLVLMNSIQCSDYTYFPKACPDSNALLLSFRDFFSISFYG